MRHGSRGPTRGQHGPAQDGVDGVPSELHKCNEFSESIRARSASQECKGEPLVVPDGARFAVRRLTGLGVPAGTEVKPRVESRNMPGKGSPPYQTFPEVVHEPPGA